MYIGKRVLVKHQEQIQEGIVKNFWEEDVEIQLADDTVITRKYWEIRKIDDDTNQRI
jgi:hypothetical protein